jgi:SAM-dependent methyltransferase
MMPGHKIPPEERRWLPESFVDPNGRVFEWRGEIYRLLAANYGALWRALFDQGVIQELVRDGLLIDSELTDFASEAEGLIIRHRRVPVVSYCFEWVPAMLKDAAMVVIELCIRLAKRDWILQDGHPWNILFEGTKPVFIDLGSIVPARSDILWAAYEQFCNFFLFPLYLYAAKRDRIARSLLRDVLGGVQHGDLLAALPSSFKLLHPRRTFSVAFPRLLTKAFERLPEELQNRFLSLSKKASEGFSNAKLRIKFLESLGRDVEGLKVEGSQSYWAGYYGMSDKNYFSTGLSPGDWREKQKVVEKLFADLKPRTLLDVGTNTGQYARLAAASGARVTACDVDASSVAICHHEARAKKLDILPLVANVFSGSPPGRGGVACPPPTERFRCEFVMGLAVVHHVVASQRLNIDRVVEVFDALCTRLLLLEFVPPLQPKIGASSVPSLDDYSSAELEACLQKRFKYVARYPSYPQDRLLFLCKK